MKHLNKFLNGAALFVIKFYRLTLSPSVGAFRFLYFTPILSLEPGLSGCKFEETCSLYAARQYRTRPFIKATRKTAARLMKCHN